LALIAEFHAKREFHGGLGRAVIGVWETMEADDGGGMALR
jgi:hypothetical protein